MGRIGQDRHLTAGQLIAKNTDGFGNGLIMFAACE
jgi:hypothetical protein